MIFSPERFIAQMTSFDMEPFEKLEGGDTNPESPLLDQQYQHRRTSSLWPRILHLILSIASLALFFASVQNLSLAREERRIGSNIFAYSPVIQDIGNEFFQVQFNGSSSPYRGPPSAEIDAAWTKLVEVGRLRISEKDLERIGKPKTAVRLPEYAGGAYLGGIDVFHQLHCLNMLRQKTYPEYYGDGNGTNLAFGSPEFVRNHLDHCIDYLRQVLMCHADVGLITWNWVESWENPYPDFDTNHVCRNFDEIIEWEGKNRIQMTPFPDRITKTAGIYVLPTAPIPPY